MTRKRLKCYNCNRNGSKSFLTFTYSKIVDIKGKVFIETAYTCLTCGIKVKSLKEIKGVDKNTKFKS